MQYSGYMPLESRFSAHSKPIDNLSPSPLFPFSPPALSPPRRPLPLPWPPTSKLNAIISRSPQGSYCVHMYQVEPRIAVCQIPFTASGKREDQIRSSPSHRHRHRLRLRLRLSQPGRCALTHCMPLFVAHVILVTRVTAHDMRQDEPRGMALCPLHFVH